MACSTSICRRSSLSSAAGRAVLERRYDDRPHHLPYRDGVIVGTALDHAGISAVLSGGGAATIYAPEVNQSHDLDFILIFNSALGVPEQCILDLGFVRKHGSYEHPSTEFTLEFLQGPLMIGNDHVTQWSTLRKGEMVLQILSPTDSVRDRLAWFMFYGNPDYSALEQALGVALHHEIDLDRIRKWAAAEGTSDRFNIFEARYESERKT